MSDLYNAYRNKFIGKTSQSSKHLPQNETLYISYYGSSCLNEWFGVDRTQGTQEIRREAGTSLFQQALAEAAPLLILDAGTVALNEAMPLSPKEIRYFHIIS